MAKLSFKEYNECWRIKVDTQHFLLGETDQYLICYRQYSKVIVIVNGEITVMEDVSFEPFALRKDSIEGCFYNNRLFYYGFLSKNLKDVNIIYSTQDKIPKNIIYNKIICFGNLNELFCFEIGIEGPLWKKTFPEDIAGDILIYKDKLLVSLKGCDFICLEQETGEEVWRCENVYGYRKIIENDRSYQLAGNFYSEIDLDNGIKIDEVNIEGLNNNEKIFPASAGIVKVKNRIYFTSSGIPRDPSTVGSFNIKTRQYDWLYRFENMQTKGFPSGSLQYHNNKLYVLDMDGTLHIFEQKS